MWGSIFYSSFFSPFCFLEYDSWSWRNHDMPSKTHGNMYDGTRTSEDGFLTSGMAPRKSVSVLLQLLLLYFHKLQQNNSNYSVNIWLCLGWMVDKVMPIKLESIVLCRIQRRPVSDRIGILCCLWWLLRNMAEEWRKVLILSKSKKVFFLNYSGRTSQGRL